MKKLIHKKWLSIPVTVFLVLVLTAGAVFAADALVTRTQIIKQTINEQPYVVNYGSITAAKIQLPGVVVGESWGCTSFPGAVVVEVGPDGVNKYLHLRIDDTTTGAYEVFAGNISSVAANNPMGSLVILGVTYTQTGPAPNILEASFLLTAEGTYTFEQTVCGIAGDTPGGQEVKWVYTLEDLPYQP